MMKEWYEGTEIEKKIPNFKSTDIKYIISLYYYIDYNSYFDQVSFLEIEFLLEVDTRKFSLRMKFNEVSSLELSGFGNSYNQIMGFDIRNLSNRGFEKKFKYLVEDYENSIIKFYCADFEILLLNELK